LHRVANVANFRMHVVAGNEQNLDALVSLFRALNAPNFQVVLQLLPVEAEEMALSPLMLLKK